MICHWGDVFQNNMEGKKGMGYNWSWLMVVEMGYGSVVHCTILSIFGYIQNSQYKKLKKVI